MQCHFRAVVEEADEFLVCRRVVVKNDDVLERGTSPCVIVKSFGTVIIAGCHLNLPLSESRIEVGGDTVVNVRQLDISRCRWGVGSVAQCDLEGVRIELCFVCKVLRNIEICCKLPLVIPPNGSKLIDFSVTDYAVYLIVYL